jgi:hypothetical protein
MISGDDKMALLTEERIKAINIGECSPIVTSLATPVSPSHKEYKVNGLPEWIIAKIKTSDGINWAVSLRTTEERPDQIKRPLDTPGPHTSLFRSRDNALDGLRQLLRDHFV